MGLAPFGSPQATIGVPTFIPIYDVILCAPDKAFPSFLVHQALYPSMTSL